MTTAPSAPPTAGDPSAATSSTPTSVSASRLIGAPAQQLFDLVADPTMHPVIDGSGSVRRHFGGWRWRWEFEELEPVDGEPITRVTETYDWSTSRAGSAYPTLFGRDRKNQEAMTRSLNRLAAYVAHSGQPL